MAQPRRHPLARPTLLDRPAARRPWHRPHWWPSEAATAADPLGRSPVLARLEAALFAADEPLAARRLASVAGIDDLAALRELVDRLRALYEADASPFQVEEVAGGYQLLTRPEFHPWLARLRKGAPETKLSGAARETLTIVAYRQPIARADIESIRGVQSGDILRQLMERGLVRIAGRDTTLGRPVLYGTTRKFLQLYGLKSLRDLPPVGDGNP
jgi:segregation and condensation protein B